MKKIWNTFKGIFGLICLLSSYLFSKLLMTTTYLAQWFPALMSQAWAVNLFMVGLTLLVILGFYSLYRTACAGDEAKAATPGRAIFGALIAICAFVAESLKGAGYLAGFPGMNYIWIDDLVALGIYFIGIAGVYLVLKARPSVIVPWSIRKQIKPEKDQ
ncbi:MAG: hypothetical protein CO002_00100 [Candidatus Portnoybacteria bacterium CG_4_8_14_3_um_filter_44_10]|uniref:Uncharacterized protein n=5 Tax=Candidatus Portnoyibacteriota TaxID=1817913 RepID=A0A2H0KQ25_9BACT|nr:MAG: hypothetical protein AUK17_02675 [Parcubacteria group bacterium CG2_30_44_18]PIQ74242.1 MAG: hypothetical protein COV85_03160 [Candidatus Portnoybacteria bacterium CG11_big_fil_rev_8_21_14_0_20_44_10]PIS16766.1 MAG: hypothetical protein COT61_02145 [Candidatus Portnoybacteria bacterium CG09_land_8_20_14_0_10_44_13]PIW75799.1 MAG: hypothetical protein CO002_00100 [Candidatus Portnoybacteria bacterium CG_4_8_14_3_um_filter_44_10]PIZ70294.1 MAG: hypothetical protein COY11_02875 [Candidatus